MVLFCAIRCTHNGALIERLSGAARTIIDPIRVGNQTFDTSHTDIVADEHLQAGIQARMPMGGLFTNTQLRVKFLQGTLVFDALLTMIYCVCANEWYKVVPTCVLEAVWMLYSIPCKDWSPAKVHQCPNTDKSKQWTGSVISLDMLL